MLSLTTVPRIFDFGLLTYDATTKRVNNPIVNNKLVMNDTRANTASGWSLTATLSQPMRTIQGQEWLNALRYVTQGNKTILNQNEQTVCSYNSGVSGN